jgi:branched-chain amino acid transport system ATP-binding protein
MDWVYSLFPILKKRRKQLAGTLSGGEQQMLSIGRGLVSQPKILLLDEPSLGLAPVLVLEIFRVIKQIHEEEGVTILLVEQNARKALGIADYGYILETGNIVSARCSSLPESKRACKSRLSGRRTTQKRDKVILQKRRLRGISRNRISN